MLYCYNMLKTLPEHMSSPPVFSGVRVTLSLVVCVMSCRSLFVFISSWPLCCLSFFNLWILITSLVSPNSSCNRQYDIIACCLTFSYSVSAEKIINDGFS